MHCSLVAAVVLAVGLATTAGCGTGGITANSAITHNVPTQPGPPLPGG